MSGMTAKERSELLALVRARARVAKAETDERAAALVADYERQSATIFPFDQDHVWKAAVQAAEDVTREAQRQIAERCNGLGIPPEFQPGLSEPYWYGRGENATASRRAELRKVATTKIEALRKAAVTQIERKSVELQEQLVATALTSDAARAFLEAMPKVAALMPALDARKLLRLRGNSCDDDERLTDPNAHNGNHDET